MKKFILFVIVLFIVSDLTAESRVWTSSKGKTLEAELVEFKDDQARLKKKDGTVLTVKLDQLSKADQEFLKKKSDTPAIEDPKSEQKNENDTQIEIFSLTVSKEPPQDEQEPGQPQMMKMHMMGRPGTTVSVLIPSPPESSVLGLDDKAELTKFVDDKETDLLVREKPKKSLAGMMFGMPPKEEPIVEKLSAEDGKWIIVDCHSPNRPAAGSRTVRLEGTIALRYGKGSKTGEHKDIPLDGKGKFVVGGETIKVTKSPQKPFMMNFPGSNQTEMKQTIVLNCSKPLEMFFEIKFLSKDGKEIEFRQGMRGQMGNSWFENYDLAEAVDSVTIVVEEYESIETVELPLAQTVEIGF